MSAPSNLLRTTEARGQHSAQITSYKAAVCSNGPSHLRFQTLLEEGNRRRKTEATDANASSSRSHAVRGQRPLVVSQDKGLVASQDEGVVPSSFRGPHCACQLPARPCWQDVTAPPLKVSKLSLRLPAGEFSCLPFIPFSGAAVQAVMPDCPSSRDVETLLWNRDIPTSTSFHLSYSAPSGCTNASLHHHLPHAGA